MTKIDRPDYCCGKCPELARGGYDCTCLGNPRCKKNMAVDLQRVLDLDQKATAGPWEDCVDPEGASEDWWILLGEGRIIADLLDGWNAQLIATYRTAAPAMAKALQEVIAFHVETGGKECLTCTDERGPKPYPCPTVKAIVKHLGGLE